MSSTITEKHTLQIAQILQNRLFPILDTGLRMGRHITADEIEHYTFLTEFQLSLEIFYRNYHVEFIRAPEGFFYLRPKATTLIPRTTFSALEMVLGKILCYLYLTPERLTNQGIFSQNEVYEELFTLVGKTKLLKLINQRTLGSDIDRHKVQEKLRIALKKLDRLGFIHRLTAESTKFFITEAVFRFGADVRSNEDPQAAQRKLLQTGEAALTDDIN